MAFNEYGEEEMKFLSCYDFKQRAEWLWFRAREAGRMGFPAVEKVLCQKAKKAAKMADERDANGVKYAK